MLGLVHRGFSLKDPKTHLANYLTGNGYLTALCGVQYEAENPAEIGYQVILQKKRSETKYRDDGEGYDLSSAKKAAALVKYRRRDT
jgi:hypothetical protein